MNISANPSLTNPRVHLVVLFGGESAEHDVSCVTAAHVIAAADPAKYVISTIGIGRSGNWVLVEPTPEHVHAGRLSPTGSNTSLEAIIQLHPALTVVVLPLLHGPLGEDGTVQGKLELANVAYVGSGVLSSAVCMDKTMTKEVLAFHGIAQPRFVALRDSTFTDTDVDAMISALGLPVFIKPANMGSSVGVSKARSRDEVADALSEAFTYDEWAICEEAIVGREIEVAVLGNSTPIASVPGEIVPAGDFYDYEDKYINNAAQLLIPAPLDAQLSHEVRNAAIKIFQALRCDGLARVDFFYEENGRGFLCNEVNTIPGFTPISMYPKLWEKTGVSYPELIDQLVDLACERHARRRRHTER